MKAKVGQRYEIKTIIDKTGAQYWIDKLEGAGMSEYSCCEYEEGTAVLSGHLGFVTGSWDKDKYQITPANEPDQQTVDNIVITPVTKE